MADRDPRTRTASALLPHPLLWPPPGERGRERSAGWGGSRRRLPAASAPRLRPAALGTPGPDSRGSLPETRPWLTGNGAPALATIPSYVLTPEPAGTAPPWGLRGWLSGRGRPAAIAEVLSLPLQRASEKTLPVPPACPVLTGDFSLIPGHGALTLRFLRAQGLRQQLRGPGPARQPCLGKLVAARGAAPACPPPPCL